MIAESNHTTWKCMFRPNSTYENYLQEKHMAFIWYCIGLIGEETMKTHYISDRLYDMLVSSKLKLFTLKV